MKTRFLVALGAVLFAVFVFRGFDKPAGAQLSYKSIIVGMTPTTDVEKSLQAAVKVKSCKHCHDAKNKKIRIAFGMKLHDALGGGDKEKYKYDKPFWKKTDGKYSPEAIKMLRDAINATAKKQ